MLSLLTSYTMSSVAVGWVQTQRAAYRLHNYHPPLSEFVLVDDTAQTSSPIASLNFSR